MQEERNKQEQIENASRVLGEKLNKAEGDLQRKQTQYLVNYVTAPGRLDYECRNLDREWNDGLDQIKDPVIREKLRSKTDVALEWMRGFRKRPIEEALRKQASECFVPYISPF